MKVQITQDVFEAKNLLADIEPFMISEIKVATSIEATDFLKFINAKSTKHDDYRVKLLAILPAAIAHIDMHAAERIALKCLHMVQLFTLIEEFIPPKQYADFDFPKFYDDKFNNLSLERFHSVIAAFNDQYFKKQI